MSDERQILGIVREYFKAIRDGQYPQSRPNLRHLEAVVLERIEALPPEPLDPLSRGGG